MAIDFHFLCVHTHKHTHTTYIHISYPLDSPVSAHTHTHTHTHTYTHHTHANQLSPNWYPPIEQINIPNSKRGHTDARVEVLPDFSGLVQWAVCVHPFVRLSDNIIWADFIKRISCRALHARVLDWKTRASQLENKARALFGHEIASSQGLCGYDPDISNTNGCFPPQIWTALHNRYIRATWSGLSGESSRQRVNQADKEFDPC